MSKEANDELHKLKDTYKLTKSTNKGLATLQIVFTLHVKEVFCTFSVNKFPLCLGLHLSLPTEVLKTLDKISAIVEVLLAAYFDIPQNSV